VYHEIHELKDRATCGDGESEKSLSSKGMQNISVAGYLTGFGLLNVFEPNSGTNNVDVIGLFQNAFQPNLKCKLVPAIQKATRHEYEWRTKLGP
jgi:hypothetical protein